MNNFDVHKAAGIIVVNKQLLLERSGGSQVCVLPGGKLEPGETPTQALIRELREELAIEVSDSDLEEIGSWIVTNAKNPNSKVKIEAFVVHSWKGEIIRSGELEELLWVGKKNFADFEVSHFVKDVVFPYLDDKNLV